MKPILTLIATIILLTLNAQTISTTRMGDIKLGMTLKEIEKVTNQKINFVPKADEYSYDQSNFTYKNIKYILSFYSHKDDDTQTMVYKLTQIETESPNIKTLSGIKVGDTLEDLWKAYKNYNISIWKSWDESTEEYSEKGRVFNLSDYDASTSLQFELYNNKIIKIKLHYEEGCC